MIFRSACVAPKDSQLNDLVFCQSGGGLFANAAAEKREDQPPLFMTGSYTKPNALDPEMLRRLDGYQSLLI
jgi:hypothetical protein